MEVGERGGAGQVPVLLARFEQVPLGAGGTQQGVSLRPHPESVWFLSLSTAEFPEPGGEKGH